MRYMLLLVRSDEDWEAMGEEGRDYGSIMAFWGRLAQSGQLLGGEELQPARTATTVSWESGRPLVTDGPFMEAKETIGGYGIFDVADLDEAMALVRSFPSPTGRAEVRPVLER